MLLRLSFCAGVSITVTSITDIVAFLISATTVLPALSSFCVYSALGVMALYILQARETDDKSFASCGAGDEIHPSRLRNSNFKKTTSQLLVFR